MMEAGGGRSEEYEELKALAKAATSEDDIYEARENRSKMRPLLIIGGIGAHLLAITIFVMMYQTLSQFNGGTAPLEWGSFLLHPLLMALAFGLFSPIGTVAYATYERLLGVSHDTAKAIHLVIQGAALVVAVLGVCTMWIKHDALAASGILGGENQPPTHFQTGHSWVGIVVVSIFALQWLGGLVVYALPSCVNSKTKRALLPLHVIFGCVAVFASLASIDSGILSWRGTAGRSLDSKDMQLKTVSLLVYVLAVCIAITFAAR